MKRSIQQRIERMIGIYFVFCFGFFGRPNSKGRQALDHPTRERFHSIIAATAARRNTADAWRAEAGLQLLQFSVVHDL
jgi:hypothetical protein